MLKRTITYDDYSDPPVQKTETVYFNLTQAEVTKMELSIDGGLKARIEKISAAKDGVEIMSLFNKIILESYGEKSDDGRRFIKSEQLSQAFSQTPMYDIIFMELVTDAKKAADFVQAILPKTDK